MFGPSEEVRRAQAAEAIGLKDIPASNDECIILIKRQEVQGLSVDMERMTEQAKWKRTQSLSMKRRVKTRPRSFSPRCIAAFIVIDVNNHHIKCIDFLVQHFLVVFWTIQLLSNIREDFLNVSSYGDLEFVVV